MQVYIISAVLSLTFVLSSTQSDEVYCGKHPDIEFATLESNPSVQYAVGTIITYTCQFGYKTKGKNNTLECKFSDKEQKAEWTQPRFVCTPQSCGDPGFINNGRRIGFLFAFPNSVKYECNEGYKLRGLSTRYCQANGLWSGRLPRCEEVTCSKPQNIENGIVTYTNLDYGSELTYKCNKGFRLNSEETVFCTSDGSWSSNNVQCTESVCDMPPQPEYGSVQISGLNNKVLAGSIALFSCDGDRIVDGPTTSKCLETGEWTFPPPKCLEPCNIPYVQNGIIGTYVQDRYRRRLFKQKTVGSEVKDNELIYLRCSDRHETLDSKKSEEIVSCENGKWSHELHCEPASCRNEPPSVQNANAVVLNPENGGQVLYLCDEDFKKVQNETIVCDFGTWKGTRPICKDTRCFVEDLSFPGIVKGRKTFYKDGEEFKVECDSRYRVTSGKQLTCKEGTWRGIFPPCVAASCTKPPPKIDHGEPEIRSILHSSSLVYTCKEPYTLTKNYQVQCLFGEWTGQPPKCEDGRCLLKNLRNSAYIDFEETDSVISSGRRLNVVCKEGYSPVLEGPICLNGKWNENSAPPCKESDCTVPMLYNGEIKELRTGDWYWSWGKFRYDRQINYITIPARTVLPFGSTVITFCYRGYSFQDTFKNSHGIICSQGNWHPDPVCIPNGQKYIPRTTTRRPRRVTTSKKPEQLETTSKAETTSIEITHISVTETHKLSSEEVLEQEIPVTENAQTSEDTTIEDECYCEYPIDDENLIAHVDDKKVEFHDKVENGSIVVFRCKHVGFHQLHGIQNIKCENCRNWHSSEFPTCTEPRRGNTIIIHENKLNVSVEGYLEAGKGVDVKLSCVAVESGQYPHWTVPSANGVSIQRERIERDSFGDILYITHLGIENVDIENEGSYGCAVENNSMNIVQLVVIDPNLQCPEFPEDDVVSVTYDMDRSIKSHAIFSCKKPLQKIDGKEILTCKSNGEWSDVAPRCIDIRCKELKENDLLRISYTNDRKIGSRASFHCFLPARRFGESYADCLENRTWSNPTPVCKTPPCVVKNVFSVLPENVVADTDAMSKTAPYNTAIKLSCAEDLIVEGEPTAKCNKSGQWVAENIKCVSGCPELSKDPETKLIISPQKDVYKLGEMVTFLCPPGMSLTTQSQLMMCLKYGWSETILPECK